MVGLNKVTVNVKQHDRRHMTLLKMSSISLGDKRLPSSWYFFSSVFLIEILNVMLKYKGTTCTQTYAVKEQGASTEIQ